MYVNVILFCAVILFCLSLVLLLFINDIKAVARNKGILIGIEKGFGKPTEDIRGGVGTGVVRLIIFISEKGGALFLVDRSCKGESEKAIVFCRVDSWSTNGKVATAPCPGNYRIAIFKKGDVDFQSVAVPIRF